MRWSIGPFGVKDLFTLVGISWAERLSGGQGAPQGADATSDEGALMANETAEQVLKSIVQSEKLSVTTDFRVSDRNPTSSW